jgi:hypothetical protein
MKHVLLLVALFFAAHSALGQTNTDPAVADTNTQQQVEYQPVYQQPHDAPPTPPPPPTPPQAANQERTVKPSSSERWRYDPAARRGDGVQKPSNQSVIERALKGINPCNVNYGGLLAEWRIAEVQETIENVYFWALIVFCSGFVLSMSYNVWLLQKVENQEQATGAIIAQLSNAHVFARRKVLETTEAYKKLVAQVDAEDAAGEEQSTQPALTSTLAIAAAITPNAPESSARSATNTRDDSALAWAASVFVEPQKSSNSVSKEVNNSTVRADQDNAHDAVPLSLRAARWQETRQEQPPVNAPIPKVATEIEETVEDLPENEKNIEPSDAEDVDAIKLALQKAMEALAAKDAQIATKDTQLRAKDDKITSQRQLVSDLNNKLKANGATGRGAN